MNKHASLQHAQRSPQTNLSSSRERSVNSRRKRTLQFVAALALTALPLTASAAAQYRLVGWNNLGMHCLDADFSVLSLLPPFNTIHAQLVDPTGKLVRVANGITVTYEATNDPTGSFNSTSAGKTNFWQYVNGLFGASPAVDQGLAGSNMPGAANVPQPMTFEPASAWFIATGIPITPYDDAGHKNTYPMMKLVARNAAGSVLATTSIVLPVSDETTCALCHASGSSDKAKPRDGWVQDADPERDFRLNILKLHDDNDGATALFQQALAQVGYNPAGLFATVSQDHKSILCASCHSSEALGTGGVSGVEPLTTALHKRMANTVDPKTGLTLDATNNRTACYTCHPGSATRCLRGAMGASVAADGTMAMQCQSCHGRMMDVASPQRTGWLSEPRCDSCHTGTATHNNGQIRYNSVYQADGSTRQAVDATFATNNNTPAAGLSLYRFSSGHGGLQCSACHGSTHAEFPSSHDNDNVQSKALQGHKGVLADCTTCHATTPRTINGGPHGMHPIGASWVGSHGDAAEGNAAACRSCHGTDYRGTVLSRSQGDRVFSTEFGTKNFWRGSQIGCYACHQGPNSENANPNRPAAVTNASASTSVDRSVAIPLKATDPDGNALTLRIVSQPTWGTVGLSGKQATYYPDGSSTGTDVFTFAAWDGSIDSNLGTVSVTVGNGTPCPPQCVTANGCDPDCNVAADHDAMVSQPGPVRVAIPASGTAVHKTLSASVTNLDATGTAAQTIRLDALDGDCPAGTVQGTPQFNTVGVDGAGSVDLAPGASASAQITLQFVAANFTTTTSRAPERCTLILRATPATGNDPTPANNDALVEINVRDLSDPKDSGATDAFIDSLVPVTLSVAKNSALATATAMPRIALDAPTGAPKVALRVTSDDGTCPAGTIGAVDLNKKTSGVQDTVNLGGGKSRRGNVQVRALASAFSTPTAPTRCTAVVTVTYTGPGGDVANDITRLVLTVTDANDK